MTDKLNQEQAEIVGLLEEECAEVIQAISKVRRFGLESEYHGITNQAALQQEIGDVIAIVYVITQRFPEICNDDGLDKAAKVKMARLRKYVPSLKDFEV